MIFVVGILVGAFGSSIIFRLLESRKYSGRLVIDVHDAMNDNPLFLELSKDINEVYKKKDILLYVAHK